jgi:hypothetical protein
VKRVEKKGKILADIVIQITITSLILNVYETEVMELVSLVHRELNHKR